MPKIKFNVALSSEEEMFLKSITHTGNGYSAREILHAQVLLHSNGNKPASKKDNRELAEWFGISPTTVNQIRKSYSENGLEAALYRKTRITPPVASKITGDFEAKVIATALAPPPEGYSRWTLRLLAEYFLLQTWKMFSEFTSFLITRKFQLSVWMKNLFSFLAKSVKEFLPVQSIWIRTHSFPNRVTVKRLIPNTSAAEQQVSLCLQNHWENGVTYLLFHGVPKAIMPG